MSSCIWSATGEFTCANPPPKQCKPVYWRLDGIERYEDYPTSRPGEDEEAFAEDRWVDDGDVQREHFYAAPKKVVPASADPDDVDDAELWNMENGFGASSFAGGSRVSIAKQDKKK